MSKYIGDTEKNLCLGFEVARERYAILLFDEADTMAGKRADVNDSHGRDANTQVSYLLQVVEAHQGRVILTTNQRAALGPAFARRLRP